LEVFITNYYDANRRRLAGSSFDLSTVNIFQSFYCLTKTRTVFLSSKFEAIMMRYYQGGFAWTEGNKKHGKCGSVIMQTFSDMHQTPLGFSDGHLAINENKLL